jgi:anti-anti-sigma regulatory factor
MAINEENNLIGYDPLEWMEGEIDKNEDSLLDDEIAAEKELADHIDVETLNDSPEYLSDVVEENAVLSTLSDDEGNITNDDESIDQSETVMMEQVVDDGLVAKHEDIATQVAGDAMEEGFASSQIDLDSTLSIQNVVNLHEQLKLSLAMHDEIEINASDVASIDTSTLQLLVSLKKDADKLQKKVSIIYPSPRFIESAHLLGLSDVLDVHGF